MLESVVSRTSINVEAINMRTGSFATELKVLEQRQHEWFLKINTSQAETNKILTSIEMELLMARGATLDNNFEGKQEL